MTEKKDPYLSELDDLADLAGEEPTRVDAEPVSSKPVVPESVQKVAQSLAEMAPDIPVQVVVVMGRKEVTVQDLLKLRMGQVVELNRAPNEAVDLVAGGHVIAQGELVEIDGKLGVRVLRMTK